MSLSSISFHTHLSFSLFSNFSSGPPSSETSSTRTTPDYSCPILRQSMEIPHSRPCSRPSSDIRISSGPNQPQSIRCSAWADIERNIKQEEDVVPPLAKRRRTDAGTSSGVHSMIPLHNIEVDMLMPSLSRRKTPSPSMASS